MTKARRALLVSTLALSMVAPQLVRPALAVGLGVTLNTTITSSPGAGTGIIATPSAAANYAFNYSLESDLKAAVTATSFDWSASNPDYPILGFSAISSVPSYNFVTASGPISDATVSLESYDSGNKTLLTFLISPVPGGWKTSTGSDIDAIVAYAVLNQAFKNKAAVGCANCTIQEVFSAYNLLSGAFSVVSDPVVEANNLINLTAEGGAGFKVTSGGSAPVPAPFPLFGAAAAFGFSRRLRRRIKLRAAHDSHSSS